MCLPLPDPALGASSFKCNGNPKKRVLLWYSFDEEGILRYRGLSDLGKLTEQVKGRNWIQT